MTTLVIAEHDQQYLNAATYSTVSAAEQLSQPIDLLVIGHDCEAVAREASKIANIQKVVHIDAEIYQHLLAENFAAVICELAGNYSHLFAPASTFGKNIMPRVAALLDVGQISDIIEIIDSQTYVRPIYAGNALATVKSNDHRPSHNLQSEKWVHLHPC